CAGPRMLHHHSDPLSSGVAGYAGLHVGVRRQVMRCKVVSALPALDQLIVGGALPFSIEHPWCLPGFGALPLWPEPDVPAIGPECQFIDRVVERIQSCPGPPCEILRDRIPR